MSTDPWAPESLIALSELVAEGFGAGSIDALADRLGDDVVLLDDIGRRCTTRATARQLFAERAAERAQQQAREQQRREELAAQGNPVRDRVRALQQAHADGSLPEMRYEP